MSILRQYKSDDLVGRYAIDTHPRPEDFNMHIHDKYEISYFISVKGEYTVEGTPYPIFPGCVIISRPSETHGARISPDREYERCVINFSENVLKAIDPERKLLRAFDNRPLGRGNLYLAKELDKTALLRAIGGLRLEDENGYNNRLEVLSRLFITLHLIDKAYKGRGDTEYMPPQNLNERIVMYVNEHLFESITVTDIAERFFLSRSQFSRVFKYTTGATPWEYITLKRLNAARDMMKDGVSAQRACESCGFGDYSAFYRAYTKHFGISPRNDGENMTKRPF